MGLLAKAFFLTLLTLCCFTTSTVSHEAPAPAPAPHHHHHHHHHHYPPPPPKPHPPPPVYPLPHPPVTPPAKPPVKPPVYPPVKPPVSPPAKPPVKPPVYPPVKPPVSPPVKPPAKPPVKPPVYPPVKPPVSPPAKPPVKPPVYPPVKPPVSPPAKPPVKPPVHPPVKPPVYPPKFNRSLVAVQGVVYCKSCKYAGLATLLDAKPVKGAVVRLVCKNRKNVVAEATTDAKGYFFLLAPKTVTNYGFRSCRAYLVKSPLAKCSKPSKLHGGLYGGALNPVKPPATTYVVINKLKYGVFNVGPFAFEPSCPR